jgi:hypothetical protein
MHVEMEMGRGREQTNEKREASMRIYKAVQPHTKEEAEEAFAQGTSEQIEDALLGVTYYVEDWRWVQSACLTLLDSSDTGVQWMAITCLGHLATFHRTLDLAIVLPALQAHASDPQLAPALYETYRDIAWLILKKAPSLVKNWDELPQELKKALIANELFDSRGKRIHRLFGRTMKHKAVEPHTKEEAEVVFSQGTSDEIINELIDITYYGKDWRWVQTTCLGFLDASDIYVQLRAITCLGNLATHGTLDLAIVLPALVRVSDPTPWDAQRASAIARKVTEAFISIAMAVKKNPGLVEDWDELPQRMKDMLIADEIFDSRGKRMKKRNFIRRFFGR